MSFAKTLSRDEMKNVIAGDTNCVICWNEGGSGPAEMIYREYGGADPTDKCRSAGPYDSGSWGECPH